MKVKDIMKEKDIMKTKRTKTLMHTGLSSLIAAVVVTLLIPIIGAQGQALASKLISTSMNHFPTATISK